MEGSPADQFLTDEDAVSPGGSRPAGERLMASIVVVSVIRRDSRTLGSKNGAHIFRSISSVSRLVPLVLAAMVAACNNGGGGTGY